MLGDGQVTGFSHTALGQGLYPGGCQLQALIFSLTALIHIFFEPYCARGPVPTLLPRALEIVVWPKTLHVQNKTHYKGETPQGSNLRKNFYQSNHQVTFGL